MLTNKAGIPDLILLKGGIASFVEVKRQGETLRPLQEYRFHELTKMGFKCKVRNE